MREEDGAEDDSQVVDERGDGLIEKDLADEELGAKNPSDEEEELRWKKDAGERGAEGGLLAMEAVEGDAGVGGCEDFGENDRHGEDDGHGVEDDRECAVAACCIACGAVA